MSEIIISFFAVIGIVFTIKYIIVKIALRKISFPVICDLRGIGKDKLFDAVFLISSVSESAAGEKFLNDYYIIIDEESKKICTDIFNAEYYCGNLPYIITTDSIECLKNLFVSRP